MMSFGVETAVTLCLTVLIIATNVLILLMLFTTDMLALFNKHFFVSLTLADLGVGLFVTPFSVWTTVFERWIYGDRFCHVEAYIAAVLYIASVQSLAWLSVDQYVALRKPDRHASIMTSTRSGCWVALVWTTAVGFCLSPLFGRSTARYYAEAYVCVVDWSSQTAYFVTAAVLLIVPSLVALAFANVYIFTATYERDKTVYDRSAFEPAPAAVSDAGPGPVLVMIESTRPELYAVNVIVGWVYVVVWLPWCILQLYCYVTVSTHSVASTERLDTTDMTASGSSTVAPVSAALHFWLTWLAIANSFWKFIVYVICFHDFRTGLKILYNNYIACR